jgi:hypothetical protein
MWILVYISDLGNSNENSDTFPVCYLMREVHSSDQKKKIFIMPLSFYQDTKSKITN